MNGCAVFIVFICPSIYCGLSRCDTSSPSTQTYIVPTDTVLQNSSVNPHEEKETTAPESVLNISTARDDHPAEGIICSEAFCEMGDGLFMINTSLCPDFIPAFNMSATYTPSTVQIWTNAGPYTVACTWNLLVPKQHRVLITFDQLPPSEGHFTIYFEHAPHEMESYGVSELSRAVVNVTLKSDIKIEYIHYFPYMNVNVTFHYVLIPIILPAVQLSNWTGYVTSPGFNYDGSYPFDYDGIYEIYISDNFSVIIKFSHFDIEPGYTPGQCDTDYVMIYELSNSTNSNNSVWKKCGRPYIPIKIFRSSIQLRFVSDSYNAVYFGFKMLYSILPTHQEPVLLTEGKYDCSASHFDKFSDLFRCNFIRECDGGEDEENCEYQYSPINGCEGGLCQTEPGFFVIYASSCWSWMTLRASTERTTVAVMVNPQRDESSTYCTWDIVVPDQHRLFITFHHLSSDLADTTVHVKNCHEHGIFCSQHLHVNSTDLQEGSVNVTSLLNLIVEYMSYRPYSSAVMTFDFHARPNILPTQKISETSGAVTSPNFSKDTTYPENYHGTFDINVPENSFVLIKIAYLSIPTSPGCENVFLMIYETHQENMTGQSKKMCGYHLRKPVSVLNSSVRIQFNSGSWNSGKGFEIIYAILPIQFQPQFLNNKLFDCTVPYFHLFQPVVKCNLIVECGNMEDETGCGYSSAACGHGALDMGDKCYSFQRPDGNITWYTANTMCKNRQQRLITIVNRQAKDKLKDIIFTFDMFFVYVGLQLNKPILPAPLSSLYRAVWQWVDDRSALTVNVTVTDGWNLNLTIPFPLCTIYVDGIGDILSQNCFVTRNVDVLCEFDKPVLIHPQPQVSKTPLVGNRNVIFQKLTMVPCPEGHVTRDFLRCDSQSRCSADTQTSCKAASMPTPMFQCDSAEQIPHTLVCDHVSQCTDGSDENFCSFRSCILNLFQCRNQQCIDLSSVCDGEQDCIDQSDEICQLQLDPGVSTIDPPAVVNFIGNGSYTMTPSSACPDTHFTCLDEYCLPVFLRCNGVADCVGGEDEAECHSYTCPGFYRCRGSAVCLHPQYMCDGLFHCPQYDDELLCQEPDCPQQCSCRGLEFACTDVFLISSYPNLRYLDVINTSLSTSFISQNWYLIGVRLSNIGITEISNLFLPNLQHFDLSHNKIALINIQSLIKLKNLKRLILRGNPVKIIVSYMREEGFAPANSISQLTDGSEDGDTALPMKMIDLSHSKLETYNGSAFSMYSQLQVLNVSYSELHTISERGFLSTPKLKTVDLSSSRLKIFPNDLLKNLTELGTVYADSFILCCEAMLPERFDPTHCHAEQDFLTSCEDLLRSNTYRAFLWVFASLAVVGNAGGFIARIYLTKTEKKLGSFSMFVSNLSLADFLMGMYLTVIGVADQVYLGEYFLHGEQWTNSDMCSLAGFLSFISSEVSAFTIYIITLDRFLVLCFPFSTFHFRNVSALVACCVAWAVGIVLAGVPLMPFTSHWRYYRQTAVCIPLPFSTRSAFQGHTYSFSVMIVLNSVVFILIAVDQILIFWSVRRNSMASSRSGTSRNAVIARRLTTIVVSDFLCWFPIGVLGLMHSTGTPVPAEINVGVIIFVLPLNSALNPFLYTFNTVMEKRQKAVEEKLLARLKATYDSKASSSTKTSAVSRSKTAGQNVRVVCD